MVRHIACRLTLQDVMDVLKRLGLEGTYSHIHVLMRGKCNRGYAFVTFLTHGGARACYACCQGRTFGESSTMKVCEIVPAKLQGMLQV